MALSGGFTPTRNKTRLPALPEDWRSQPENIDPKTGQPIKRRKARMNLAATAVPGGKNTTTVPGQSTQGLAPGATAPRASNPAQGAPQVPGAARTAQPGAGAPGGIASQSTIAGPLGTLEPHGQIAAAADPRTLYGQILPGGSSGRAAGFYGEAFNPIALSAASGMGMQMQTNQDYLMAGQQLANEFSGGAGAGKFLNPVQMMQNITQYAQEVMNAVRGGDPGVMGGPLAGLADMDPPQALAAFINIVKGAMISTMPEDVANAYAAMLERVGYDYIDQYYQNPIENDTMPGAGVINYLASQLGPAMGLNTGNAGGVGTTQAGWAQAF